MFISYKWLQSYFEEKLPAPEKLSDVLTFLAFEVEGIEKKGDDTIFDLKVLPDRACYALSHRGMAYEVSAATGFKRKIFVWPQPTVAKTHSLEVKVEAPELCSRYAARVIENVTAKSLPWVKEHLEAVGQRSINPIVDGANIVMFDMGQPLHAFDADKVEGDIVVRMARKGEKIVTLDNREVALDEKILVIADSKDPLAIAGIKGGKKAEVTESTKNLILEGATFEASYIRKASERLGIRTDASKRFENRVPAESAIVGVSDLTAYLFEMDKNIVVGEIVDWHPNKLKVKSLKVERGDINTKLSVSLSEKEIEDIFSKLQFKFEKEKGGWAVTPPAFRLDLNIPEDIAEEVGRLFGYDKVPAVLPPKSSGKTEIPKSFYYEWKIRELLASKGFSEVMTSSFYEKGSVAIEKPLASDKSFARENLRGSFAKALAVNTLNAPLFETDEVRIFEIGRVFSSAPGKTELSALAIGYGGPKKKVVAELSAIVAFLSERLGVAISGETKDGVFECALDVLFDKLPAPTSWDIKISPALNEKYQTFSLYPFIVRDIALFVPSEISASEVYGLILKEASNLVVRSWLFDRFEKPARTEEQGGEAKISYAFRLVFQSPERTLTDEEVNKIMDKVTSVLNSKTGWKVR